MHGRIARCPPTRSDTTPQWRLPASALPGPRRRHPPPTAPAASFDEVLRGAARPGRRRSASRGHALERLPAARHRLRRGDHAPARGGVAAAAAKGSRDALVLVDGTAFVVSVPNRTVITAVDPDQHEGPGVHQHRQRGHRLTHEPRHDCRTGRTSLRKPEARREAIPMMRGMFAAISGLQGPPDDAGRDGQRHRQRQHHRLQGRAHQLQGRAVASSSAAPARRAPRSAAPTRPRSASASS